MHFNFAMNTMNDLTESYFSQVRLWTASAESIRTAMEYTESVAATKSTIRLVLKSEFVPGPGEDLNYAPLLDFPDREGYVDCSHPGNSDDYFLYLEMNIHTIDGFEYEVANFVWREEVEKGAL